MGSTPCWVRKMNQHKHLFIMSAAPGQNRCRCFVCVCVCVCVLVWVLPVRPAAAGSAQKSAGVSAVCQGWPSSPDMTSPLAAVSSFPRSGPAPTKHKHRHNDDSSYFSQLWMGFKKMCCNDCMCACLPPDSHWRTCAAGTRLQASVFWSPWVPEDPPRTHSVHLSTLQWWQHQSDCSQSSHSPSYWLNPSVSGRLHVSQ